LAATTISGTSSHSGSSTTKLKKKPSASKSANVASPAASSHVDAQRKENDNLATNPLFRDYETAHRYAEPHPHEYVNAVGGSDGNDASRGDAEKDVTIDATGPLTLDCAKAHYDLLNRVRLSCCCER
jgi:hypothetical protein